MPEAWTCGAYAQWSIAAVFLVVGWILRGAWPAWRGLWHMLRGDWPEHTDEDQESWGVRTFRDRHGGED